MLISQHMSNVPATHLDNATVQKPMFDIDNVKQHPFSKGLLSLLDNNAMAG